WITDESGRWHGSRRRIPREVRAGVRRVEEEGEVAGGRRCATSLIVGEIDRPRRCGDERPHPERRRDRVRGARDESAGHESEPIACKHDLIAVYWLLQGSSQRSLEGQHEDGLADTGNADPADVGCRAPVEEFGREISRKRYGLVAIREPSGFRAGISRARVEALPELQAVPVHVPPGIPVRSIDRPDRSQALRILRPRPACGENDAQDCRQSNAPCQRATLHLSYLRDEDFGARGEDRKSMMASSSATRPVAGAPADFKPSQEIAGKIRDRRTTSDIAR